MTQEKPADGAPLEGGVRPLVERLRMAWPETPHHRDALHREAADEIERLRGEVAMLRATMEGAVYQLTKARIWGGMEWHYNQLHPMHYRPALERLREVLDRPNGPHKRAPQGAK